jgi:hypothetical protein
MVRHESNGYHDERGIDMLKKSTWPMGHTNELLAAGIGAVLLAMEGCAGEAPKPAPTMTQDQVRSNADKGFEKLKQEEKNRAVGSEPAPY